MKPVAFDYARPTSLPQALAMLAGNTGAKVLAGGQTLGPMLNLRLAQPQLLVDITRIAELAAATEDADSVTIGAIVTHAAIEDGRAPDPTGGFMRTVARGIAYRAVRTRGTIGGSLAHADPSAEIGLVAATLGATMTASDGERERRIGAADFFRAPMATALAPGECMTAVRFPIWTKDGRIGAGFQEVSARDSDFAIVAAAAQIALDRDGICRRAPARAAFD